jgi:hypothetical protein
VSIPSLVPAVSSMQRLQEGRADQDARTEFAGDRGQAETHRQPTEDQGKQEAERNVEQEHQQDVVADRRRGAARGISASLPLRVGLVYRPGASLMTSRREAAAFGACSRRAVRRPWEWWSELGVPRMPLRQRGSVPGVSTPRRSFRRTPAAGPPGR